MCSHCGDRIGSNGGSVVKCSQFRTQTCLDQKPRTFSSNIPHPFVPLCGPESTLLCESHYYAVEPKVPEELEQPWLHIFQGRHSLQEHSDNRNQCPQVPG